MFDGRRDSRRRQSPPFFDDSFTAKRAIDGTGLFLGEPEVLKARGTGLWSRNTASGRGQSRLKTTQMSRGEIIRRGRVGLRLVRYTSGEAAVGEAGEFNLGCSPPE